MYNRLDAKLVYLETDRSEEICGKWKPKNHSCRQGYGTMFTTNQINGEWRHGFNIGHGKTNRDALYFYIFLIVIYLSIVSAITQTIGNQYKLSKK